VGDKVFLERIKPETMSKGGIILPNSGTPLFAKGRVIAVGPGRTLDSGAVKPMEVSVGDVVLFHDSIAYELPDDGKKYVMLPEGDIHGVLPAQVHGIPAPVHP
jgi:chaperonin GroES